MAAAASPSFVWAEQVQVKFGDQVVGVEVDEKYWQNHPEQHGLQAVAATERERNDAQDARLDDHEDRLSDVESEMPGRELEQVEEYPPPGGASPGMTGGTTSVSQSNGDPMLTLAVVFGMLAIGAIVWVAIVLTTRLGQGQNCHATQPFGQATNLVDGTFRASFIGADGSGAHVAAMGSFPRTPGQPVGQPPAARPAPAPAPAPRPAAPAAPAPAPAAGEATL